MKKAIGSMGGGLAMALLVVGCGSRLDLGTEPGTDGGAGAAPTPRDGGAPGEGGTGGKAGAGAGGSSGAPTVQRCESLPKTGWIAFDSDRADFNRDIYRMRPDGTGVERLTEDPGVDAEPSFTADGLSLVFTSDRSGSRQVHLLDLASGDVSQLTHGPAEASQGSVSHDGKLLAFHRAASVYILDLETQVEHVVATGPDVYNAYASPKFSPDDSLLYYDRGNEIDVSKLDGSEMRYVVQNSTTTIAAPAISPDGRELAYHVYCDSGLSLWTSSSTINTNPCEGRRVTPPGDLESSRPTWGPGQLIAYERVNSGLNVAQIAIISRAVGSKACPLTPTTADDRNPSWFIEE